MFPGTYTLQAPTTAPTMVEVSLAPGTTLKVDADGVVRNEYDSELFRLEPVGSLIQTMPIPVQVYEDLIDRKTALEDQVLALAEQVVHMATRVNAQPIPTYFAPSAQPIQATAGGTPQWQSHPDATP